MSKGDGVVLDTGPLVALLDAADEHHAWAAAEFSRFAGKVRVCEAVLAEALFLLRTLRPAQEKILEWVERGELTCDFVLPAEARAVRALWRRYANVPMSLADACVVRMAEMHPRSVICTMDSIFPFIAATFGIRSTCSPRAGDWESEPPTGAGSWKIGEWLAKAGFLTKTRPCRKDLDPSRKPSSRNAPVSGAIDVQVDDPKLLREAVIRALRAVDAVHDDLISIKVPLKANPHLRRTLACYHFRGFQPIDIEINSRKPGTAFNVLEEIAHFLDHQALGTAGDGFASAFHAALEPWRVAAGKSPPVRSLRRAAKRARGFHESRLQEACAVHEVFARSAQYIAVKSQDPILLAGLEADRNSGFGDILHWNDAEFQVIMKAFDQLFADQNWT